MKTCSKCRETKSIEAFSTDRRARDGLCSSCRACAIERVQSWRKANPERVAAKNKAWYTTNRERLADQKKAYHAAHPGAKQALNAKRRARKLAADGAYTTTDIKRLRAEQNDCCAYCKSCLDGKGHIDHIYPLAKGGSNWPSNLQLLCVPCNSHKHTKDPIAHMVAIGLIDVNTAEFLGDFQAPGTILRAAALHQTKGENL